MRSGGVRVWVVRLGVIGLVLCAWQLGGGMVKAGGEVFPPISEILSAWVHVVQQPFFFSDISMTLQEITSGFLVGSALGLVFGTVIGSSRVANRVLEPMLFWASGVPKIVLLPILLSVLGAGIALKAGHASLSAFFPVSLGTATAIKTMPPIYGLVAKTSGASRLTTFFRVSAPAVAGQILTALRLGLAVAIVSALLAETAVATGGLGWRAMQYYQQLQVPEMYATILTVFLAAMVINVAVERLIQVYTKHFEESDVSTSAN